MMQIVSKFLLCQIFGWRWIGSVPNDLNKFLMVGFPHTSNWDSFYGWLLAKALGIKLTFFVKDTFYVGPFKLIYILLGLTPVNRRESNNFVESVAAEFRKRDKVVGVIAPEGTRKAVDKLKSGYYYLAKSGEVPLVLVGAHYSNRTFTIMPPRMVKSTFEEDQEDILAFCRTMEGRYPQNTFPK